MSDQRYCPECYLQLHDHVNLEAHAEQHWPRRALRNLPSSHPAIFRYHALLRGGVVRSEPRGDEE